MPQPSPPPETKETTDPGHAEQGSDVLTRAHLKPPSPHDLTDHSKATAFDQVTQADTDQPGSHRGMRVAPLRADDKLHDEPPSLHQLSVKSSRALPHERDQDVHMTGGEPVSPQIEQARLDVEQGLADTSRAVEMDRTYKEVKKDAPDVKRAADSPARPAQGDEGFKAR